MTYFYLVPSSVRMLLQILLYLGIASEIVTLILYFYQRSDRRLFYRVPFEIGITYHLIIMNMCIGLIQINAPENIIVEPYPMLRSIALIAPILGVPGLMLLQRQNDLLAIFCLTLSLPFVDQLMGRQSAWLLFFLNTLLVLRAVMQMLIFYRELRNTLSRFSMKEAFDTFPEGLAIGKHHGSVLLLNRRMREIMQEKGLIPTHRSSGLRLAFRRMLKKEAISREKLMESDINLNRLSRELLETETVIPQPSKGKGKKKQPQPVRKKILQSFESQGREYRYTDEPFNIGSREYRQILISDITREKELITQISEKNEELEQSNRQIEELLNNIEEIETERESGRMRNRIHDVMGQRLSIIHSTLQQMEHNKMPPLDELMVLLEDMLKDLHEPEKFDAEARYRNIKNTAEIVGTVVLKEGDIPSDSDVSRVLLQVLREAVTNSIRHGGAKQVRVQFSDDEANWYMETENNGSVPNQQLHEGEGIRGMRKKLAEIGGRLEIHAEKVFRMKITVDKSKLPLEDY